MLSTISLLVAVTSPMPVSVQNWPGPDSVALDTLKYARWAFWATVAIGIPALAFGVVDYALNMRQFRRPKLTVSLRGAGRDARPLTGSIRGDGRDCIFNLPLQLNNDGSRGANGCYVTIWLPRPLDWNGTSDGWEYGGDLLEPDGPIEYQRVEALIEQPLFVDHPILLPNLSIKSAEGKPTFHFRWQVNDENGKSPQDVPARVDTGVD